ncbi:type II secretion system minor pseudopilin GspK [Thermodesulfobacteriota bacterium]
MKKINRNEGVALIITLMIIALLVAVVVEFNRIAIADIEVSRNFGNEKKVLFLMISGTDAIKEFLRLDGVYTKSDTLLEHWALSEPLFISAGSMIEEGKISGTIVDENGKINVNSLVSDKGTFDETQKTLWLRLLTQNRFNLTEEEANTIIHGVKDWIDKDDEISGIYGAENSFYQGKGYGCANSSLNILEEMLLINGMTKTIFYGDRFREGVRPYFTVYGGSQINVNTAPIPILMALSDDMTEDIAMEWDTIRRDETNKALLLEKDWYKKFWPYETPLPEKLLTVSSDHFTVYIKGTLGETMKQVKTVIYRSNDLSKIVYWQEL